MDSTQGGGSRAAGLLLVVAGTLGLALSLTGIVATWRIKARLVPRLETEINLITEALHVTSEGLQVAEASLDVAVDNLSALEGTLITATDTVSDTTPVFDSLSALLGRSLPATIRATNTSLVSAQSSAKIMEDLLTALTSIPFLPLDPYEPEVPLYLALGQVSENLVTIPETLVAMEGDLNRSGRNLEAVGSQMRALVADMEQISLSLQETQGVIQDYQDVVGRLSTRMTTLGEHLPGWATQGAWVATGLFAWIGLTHLSLLAEGLRQVRR